MSTAPSGYSRAQIALHWLTAVAVLVAWFTQEAMEETAEAVWEAGGGPFPTVHTVAGFSAFVLILGRLWLRRRRGAPEPQGSERVRMAATWGHRLLYALVLLVPSLGALTWFGGFQDLGEVHELAAQALLVVALGHAAMALWHQYGKKDGTLMRMLRPE